VPKSSVTVGQEGTFGNAMVVCSQSADLGIALILSHPIMTMILFHG
jgi:hypothetical protein